MDRSQYAEGVKPIQDSDMTVIEQHHLHSFVTIQKVKGTAWFAHRLYSADRHKVIAVINAVVAEGGFQHSSLRIFNVRNKVFHILDLVNSDPDVHALVSS